METKKDIIQSENEKINKSPPLPQSEAEWLATGKFNIETVRIGENNIRCALAKGSKGTSLTTMVGGIPRDPKRRENLPLINKLYGHLAEKMLSVNESSLLYNQPGTGGSTGDWEKENLKTRVETLVGVADFFYKEVESSSLSIIGTSAGGYMAVKSAEELKKKGINISKLALLSPAAYPEDIEDIPYGEKFSEVNRKPWDVATSPIFPAVRKFVIEGGSVFISFF